MINKKKHYPSTRTSMSNREDIWMLDLEYLIVESPNTAACLVLVKSNVASPVRGKWEGASWVALHGAFRYQMRLENSS